MRTGTPVAQRCCVAGGFCGVQLFQGSFWKNRNFFKGVFIKGNPKRHEAKKASYFFDTHTLFLDNLMCECRFVIRVQYLQHSFYATQSCSF